MSSGLGSLSGMWTISRTTRTTQQERIDTVCVKGVYILLYGLNRVKGIEQRGQEIEADNKPSQTRLDPSRHSLFPPVPSILLDCNWSGQKP